MKVIYSLILLSALLVSCTGNENENQSASANQLSGTVKIDGSSTVFPITEAIAEDFAEPNPRVRVTIGVSGTGGGFKKFLASEVDINNASRTIKDSEKKKAQESGLKYIELPVAFDGVSVVVNKANDWVNFLTVDELKKIWSPGSVVKTWKDVRTEWPDKAIKLYGPGADSGTFDYFTHAIMGKAQMSRSDYTKSEDDNILVMGVAGDEASLGYFGFAYYEENKSKLKLVAIKSNKDSSAVLPSSSTISSNEYKPLSRPVFVYINKKSLAKPEVNEFVNYYIDNAARLSKEVGYVPMPQSDYDALRSKLK